MRGYLRADLQRTDSEPVCEITPRVSIDLPRDESAPAIARSCLASYLCSAHSLGVADDAALLTTEAVTNALKYGGPPLGLAVECNGALIEISISDANPVEPICVEADPLAESGRGVALIDSLSDEWGVHQHPDDGKDVWFRLSP